jgi:hypothetical protein
VAFRCGGDEFLLLLPACDEKNARGIADRLTSLVDTMGKTLHLTKPPGLSIGLSMMVPEAVGITPDELMSLADKNLYAVKPRASSASPYPPPSSARSPAAGLASFRNPQVSPRRGKSSFPARRGGFPFAQNGFDWVRSAAAPSRLCVSIKPPMVSAVFIETREDRGCHPRLYTAHAPPFGRCMSILTRTCDVAPPLQWARNTPVDRAKRPENRRNHSRNRANFVHASVARLSDICATPDLQPRPRTLQFPALII